jgi:outer membrane protein OmpA-like peptidoglycan-associated protein
MALPLRRASAVAAALIREGVPAMVIAIEGRGEEDLLIPTADGVPDLQNRHAVIIIWRQ